MSNKMNVIAVARSTDTPEPTQVVMGAAYTAAQVQWWEELRAEDHPGWSYKGHLWAVAQIPFTPFLDLILD